MLKQNTLAFHPTEYYPVLDEIATHWMALKDEAIHSLNHMSYILDNRINPQEWRVLPLLPEKEDRMLMNATEIEMAREQAPLTCELLDRIPQLHAYAFSSLAPKATIQAHQHHNPYVTAMLCLQAEGDVYIDNNNERRYFKEGELIIFD